MAEEKIWASLLHIGTNMWRDKDAPPLVDDKYITHPSGTLWEDEMQFDREVFDRVTDELPSLGFNTVVLDIGDGVRYDSHPEIGVKGALTPDELRELVRQVRAKGLNPVPKLNFSAGHDAWLGEYERMLTTDIYRQVIGDLIHEICDIFEKPTHLHLGMDEETAMNQAAYGHVVVRAEEHWWKDFYHMVDCCEKDNMRPWIWSDCYWHRPESFAKKMPKSVLQSNWHYWALKGEKGDEGQQSQCFRAFFGLEELGYDQVPTTTIWSHAGNSEQVVKALSDAKMKNIKGFMTASWVLTHRKNYHYILADAALLGYAKELYGDTFE